MVIKSSGWDITKIIVALNKQQVIAYPTESVFGLGCDPNSESAIKSLLALKQRSWQKGLILVASNYEQLQEYINNDLLHDTARERILKTWPNPITWIVPTYLTTSHWLTGKYIATLAVRISTFEPIRQLCIAFNKPLVSTSANLSGQAPARNSDEVRKQLGNNFPIIDEAVEGHINPSEIRDILSGKLIRRS